MDTMNGTVLTRASEEWRNRPDDERFTSLEDLKASVLQRKRESWTVEGKPSALSIVPSGENSIGVQVRNRTTGEDTILAPTHFAFGQLAQNAR
jgi:hypothetical protein